MDIPIEDIEGNLAYFNRLAIDKEILDVALGFLAQFRNDRQTVQDYSNSSMLLTLKSNQQKYPLACDILTHFSSSIERNKALRNMFKMFDRYYSVVKTKCTEINNIIKLGLALFKGEPSYKAWEWTADLNKPIESVIVPNWEIWQKCWALKPNVIGSWTNARKAIAYYLIPYLLKHNLVRDDVGCRAIADILNGNIDNWVYRRWESVESNREAVKKILQIEARLPKDVHNDNAPEVPFYVRQFIKEALSNGEQQGEPEVVQEGEAHTSAPLLSELPEGTN
jgi:hypothetical protein